jgi:hypothetical protein
MLYSGNPNASFHPQHFFCLSFAICLCHPLPHVLPACRYTIHGQNCYYKFYTNFSLPLMPIFVAPNVFQPPSVAITFLFYYHIYFGKIMFVTPSAPVHKLQCGVLNEIKQLNAPQQGIIEMEVDVGLPIISLPCCFAEQDICSAIYNNHLSKALIHFLPTYTLYEKGREELYADLKRVALHGSDHITLWGKGMWEKPKWTRQWGPSLSALTTGLQQ